MPTSFAVSIVLLAVDAVILLALAHQAHVRSRELKRRMGKANAELIDFAAHWNEKHGRTP